MSWFKRKPKPIYCKECGAKLVPNTHNNGYDPQTGKPILPWLDELVCPNVYCGLSYNGWD